MIIPPLNRTQWLQTHGKLLGDRWFISGPSLLGPLLPWILRKNRSTTTRYADFPPSLFLLSFLEIVGPPFCRRRACSVVTGAFLSWKCPKLPSQIVVVGLPQDDAKLIFYFYSLSVSGIHVDGWLCKNARANSLACCKWTISEDLSASQKFPCPPNTLWWLIFLRMMQTSSSTSIVVSQQSVDG